MTNLSWSSQLQRDLRYGIIFLLIAVSMATLVLEGGWKLVFSWPAISVALVGLSYICGQVRIFGKRGDGTRHWLASLGLLPYLVLAHVVWWVETSLSSEPATSTLNDFLIISRRLRWAEIPHDVALICDLTCEFNDPVRIRSEYPYICHPILDAGTINAKELAAFAKSLPPSAAGKLLIHCANGHGRTGMFAAIWLVAHGFVPSVDDAIKRIRESRPGVSLGSRQYQVALQAASLVQN